MMNPRVHVHPNPAIVMLLLTMMLQDTLIRIGVANNRSLILETSKLIYYDS